MNASTVRFAKRANLYSHPLACRCLVAGLLVLGMTSLAAAAPPDVTTTTSTLGMEHQPTVVERIFGITIHTAEDECSYVPEFNFAPCCGEHDIAYEIGGSERDRKAADKELRRCIWNVGRPVLAVIYYLGVRLFGWLFFNFFPIRTQRTARG